MSDNQVDRSRWRSTAPHRLPGFDYADPAHAYFLTMCARSGTPFTDERLASEVVASLHWLRANRGLVIYAYVLMPDHLHLLVRPRRGDRTVGALIGAFKSFTTRQSWDLGHRGALWQPRFYDHVVDDHDEAIAIMRYILENPVRKGLVQMADDYRWSEQPDAPDEAL